MAEERDRQFERDRALDAEKLRELAREIDTDGYDAGDVIDLCYTLAVVREEVNRLRDQLANAEHDATAAPPRPRKD